MDANRTQKLENHLSKECSFSTLTNPDNMEEVDFSRTPRPIVELFYEFGDGDFPNDQNAYLEPVRQDLYAHAAYMYCKRHTDNPHNFREETKNAWLQRFKKAWASITRDLHFSYMMLEYQAEHDLYDGAYFSLDKDINEGADFIVVQDREYHINLFVDSNKSRKFVDKKKSHRQGNKKPIDLEVPMTFNGTKKSLKTSKDDIWLYCDKHVEAVDTVVNTLDTDEVTDGRTTLCKRM